MKLFELVIWIVVGIAGTGLLALVVWMLYLMMHPEKMREVFGPQTKVANLMLFIGVFYLGLAARALAGH